MAYKILTYTHILVTFSTTEGDMQVKFAAFKTEEQILGAGETTDTRRPTRTLPSLQNQPRCSAWAGVSPLENGPSSHDAPPGTRRGSGLVGVHCLVTSELFSDVLYDPEVRGRSDGTNRQSVLPTSQSRARAGGKLHQHHVVQTTLKLTADFPKTLAFPILETGIKFSHHTYLTV